MALIEREALLSAAIDVEVNGVTISAVPAGIIRYAPTIDAATVVHGRWVEYMPVLGAGDLQIRCSECGLTNDVRTRYCPNCGARMEGGEGHEAD